MENVIDLRVTKAVIEENMQKVINNEPLTMSLALLSEKFKKAYKHRFGEFEKLSPEEKNARKKESRKRYSLKPGALEKRRAYQKKYNRKPEIMARNREYQREYVSRPEVRERLLAYNRERYMNKKIKQLNKRNERKKPKDLNSLNSLNN